MARFSSIQAGDRFGRLLVVRQLPKSEYDAWSVKRTLFLCRCDCGTERVFDAGNLKKPAKSCGCLQKENARLQGQRRRTVAGFLNNYWGEYRRQARNRGIPFDLPKDVFCAMVQLPCDYCGAAPEIREKATYTGLPVPTHGLDRVDSRLGYELANVVPCCAACNLMKRHTPRQEFIAHCVRVAHRFTPLALPMDQILPAS